MYGFSHMFSLLIENYNYECLCSPWYSDCHCTEAGKQRQQQNKNNVDFIRLFKSFNLEFFYRQHNFLDSL